MRVLVTGAGGFAGRHVVSELARAGHTPISFNLENVPGIPPQNNFVGNLEDAGTVNQVVERVGPDACIHLGGIAYVPIGWSQPGLMFSVNVMGTINLLEAFHRLFPATRILVVTSAEVYGSQPGETLTESSPMRPANMYAVSKVAADQTALLYGRHYGMPVIIARPGNHVGPGQSPQFVVPDFAGQVVAMMLGKKEPLMKVGNLDSERDFMDVHDVARAYRLLIERGRGGEAYNIASGRTIRVGAILDELCRLGGIKPRIEVEPSRYRPAESPPHIDTSKIRTELGWQPETPMAASLKDVLEDAKQRASQSR